MSTERRHRERHRLHIPVKVAEKPFSENPPVIESTMSNISSGGMFITTEFDFPLAAKIFLEFSLNFEDLAKLKFVLSLEHLRNFSGKTVKVNASGIVIRVQKDGAGIIFDKDYLVSPI